MFAIFAAVREFFASRPRLDILVNNAVAMQVKPFASLTPEDFAITYASAVTTAFEAVRAARPALEKAAAAAGDASVINIASMYGLVSPDARLYADPGHQSPFHYGPAKAALLQLTRHLAAELGPRGIPRQCPRAWSLSRLHRSGGRGAAGGPHHAGAAGAVTGNRRATAVPGLSGLVLHDRFSHSRGWWLDGLVIEA